MRYMAGKRRKGHLRNIVGYGAMFAVVAAMIIINWVNSANLQTKLDAYDAREAELEELIEQEKDRTQEIEEKKKYMQTKQYIAEIAQEKFGLVYPDEVVLKKKQ
jgi:cell division protein DivIC